MRILFVIHSLGPGGAERSLAELLPPLVEAGVEPTVVCLHRATEGFERQVVADGFDVRVLGARSRLGLRTDLRQLINVIAPDLVSTTIFEADVIGRLAAAGTGVPVLTSLVNTSYARVRLEDPKVRRWRLAAVRAVDGWTARRLTTHFHAISHAVKDAAVRDLGIRPNDVSVIERGRDSERLGEPSRRRRETARGNLGLGADDMVLVTVGRQEFQKGHWHLVEAVSWLAEEHPRLRLLLAGRRGSASGRIDAAARAGEGRVMLLGHRDDVPEVLAAADLFIFPSLYEGLGGALIEAMALGLPIVASDLPAIREVVEPGVNALLVPAGSTAHVATAIEALIDDESRRRSMSLRSRAIFEERFTLDRSANRMLELFEAVAQRSSTPWVGFSSTSTIQQPTSGTTPWEAP